MSNTRTVLVILLLLALNFSLATCVQPRFANLAGHQSQSGDAIEMALGDAKRLFANHFFVKADVYFHRGYYPSFIEQGYQNNPGEIHIKERGEDHDDHDEIGFMGKPRNWIDSFSRNFFPSHHTHRDGPGEAKEIMPWLKLSAELDPQRIDTYTTASYWLCSNMGKYKEAEEFLRQGLRANPDSFEILYELGQIHRQYLHDPGSARNLWELALRRWLEQDEDGKEPELVEYDRIVANLANLEEEQGNLQDALDYLKAQVNVSPQPEGIRKHIVELETKLGQGAKG